MREASGIHACSSWWTPVACTGCDRDKGPHLLEMGAELGVQLLATALALSAGATAARLGPAALALPIFLWGMTRVSDC